MTARPVPAEQDHIDAVTRVRRIGQYHRPASVSVERDSVTCVCGHESTNPDGLEEHRATVIVLALWSDPDLLAVWAARHPTALLDALTNAGVLRRNTGPVCRKCYTRRPVDRPCPICGAPVTYEVVRPE